jgi:hypothetical protein
VEGITSARPAAAASRTSASASASGIRRGGPGGRDAPNAHIGHARLQSSGFVTRVSRHGPAGVG